MQRFRVVFFLAVAVTIPLVTLLVIQLAKGYRLDWQKKKFTPQGILVATSTPDGAQVFINGKMETATNNTLPLPPGEYSVEIKKDGYYPWSKKLKIEKELVVKTEAYLFPKAPSLKPLTFDGVQNPLLSPDKTKLVYYSQTASQSGKTGYWTLDLVDMVFNLIERLPKQILSTPLNWRLEKNVLTWSSDSRQILLTNNTQNFLLDPDNQNLSGNLVNLNQTTLNSLKENWQTEKKILLESKVKKLPLLLQPLLATNAANLIFSPDGDKLLYEATASAAIPENLIPPLFSSSTQKEEREIKPENWYVYDLKEDRNFFITKILQPSEKISNLSWFLTSRHLVLIEKDKISLVEYDGANQTTVFTGPFENSYVFPSPNSAKIIILTTFGQEPNQPPNLYSIILR